MDSSKGVLAQLFSSSVSSITSLIIISVLCPILATLLLRSSKEPPSLKGRIPIFSNTYEYMTNMQGFLERVAAAQRKSNIVKFWLGPQKVYMVSGEHNIQSINKPSHSISPDVFLLQIMENVWGMTKTELAKFRQDKSGRSKAPIPGYDVAEGQPRLWYGQHHVYSQYLQRTEASKSLADKYVELFSEKLANQPLGEWKEMSLINFFESDMAEAALVALMGPRILELNQDFWPAMWGFARLAPQLMWGLPQWINRSPWLVRERFHNMCGRYVESGLKNFNWDGPEAESDWEPNFGSQMSRELVKWATEHLSVKTTAGLIGTFIFGTNANSVPMSTWVMMELISDPSLYQAVREECLRASTTDPVTGKQLIDPQKLLAMPLLQSIYTETLRLHISINVTREVTQPVTLDGFILAPGSLIQAPAQIGHYNEAVWSSDKHPASKFWAARHIKYVDGNAEFTMAGRASSFFPFGGGTSICPGRVFAKQEILMTVAILVTRFEIEYLQWTTLDGAKSDRPAQNDNSFIGAVGIPPDRDMKIRWKRLW